LICWRYHRRRQRRRRRRRHPPAAWSTRETVSVCSEALCAPVRSWKAQADWRSQSLSWPVAECWGDIIIHEPWSSH
jgi:hypothetical protein